MSNKEVITKTDAYFEDLPKSFFVNGFGVGVPWRRVCVPMEGDRRHNFI